MFIRKFLSIKILCVIALIMTAHLCSSAQEQLNRFESAVASSPFKYAPSVLGTLGAVGLLAKNTSSSDWYKLAAPAALLAGSSLWATYAQSLQRANERSTDWNWKNAVKWSSNNWQCTMPPAITAVLATSLGAYRNSWMRGLLGAAAVTAIPAWYAISRMNQNENDADNDAKEILTKARDIDWNNNQNNEDLTATLWALERLNNLEQPQIISYFQEPGAYITVSQYNNLSALKEKLKKTFPAENRQLAILNSFLPTNTRFQFDNESIQKLENNVAALEAEITLRNGNINNILNRYYMNIESTLLDLANIDGVNIDFNTILISLFKKYPNAMAQIHNEFNTRTELDRAADPSEIKNEQLAMLNKNRSKVQDAMEKAKQAKG